MDNDKELFESAIADTPPEVETPVETPVVEATDDGPVRDDQGRFAPKEVKAETVAETPVALAAPAAKDTDAHVPSWRLREEREAREAADRRANGFETQAQTFERQLADMARQMQTLQQPKQEPVDFFTDPNAAFKQNVDPLRQQFEQALFNQKNAFSEMLARQSPSGDALVDEVKKWVNTRINDPVLNARVERSQHPWGELIKSYKEHKALEEIGSDPAAFKTKTLEDALKDPAFLAKAIEAVKAQASGQSSTQTQPTNLVQLPPSINRATSAASPHDEAVSMSDASMFAYATKR